jgi:anti-sigma-K factor RskA
MTGTADHDQGHVDDLIAAYVLDALDPEELELVERHLEHCTWCQAAVAEARAAIDLLAYLPEPQPVPLRARHRLLARLQADAATPLEAPPIRLRSRLGWVAAAVAAVLALAFAWQSLQSQAEVQQREARVRELEQRGQVLTQFVNNRPQGFVMPIESTAAAPGARGGVILDPTSNAALVMIEGLPRLPTGQAYVVWLVDRDRYINAGVLPVDDQGRGELYLTPQEALSTFTGIAITVETGALASSPNGQPVAQATIGR